MIEVLGGLALAAAAPRPDLGLALPSVPLGPLVAGLPAHPGWSHSSTAHPAALVQPPSLAAHRSPLCSVAGLAGDGSLFQDRTGESNLFRWLLVRLPMFWCGLGLLLLLLWLSSFSSIGSSLVPYRGPAGVSAGCGRMVAALCAPQRRRLG